VEGERDSSHVESEESAMWESILWFLIFGAFFYFMMKRGGCGMHAHGGHGHGEHGHHAGHEGPNAAPARAEESVKDPVCGMTIRTTDAEGSTRYKGRAFYFCSTSCQAKFLHDPDRYAA
jgi:YHS domain-containing protein